MIVVKVYHWPNGDPDRAREIATSDIANISDLAELSSYVVVAAERESDVTGLPSQSAGFEIHSHERRQSVWGLVAKVAMHAAMQFTRRAGG